MPVVWIGSSALGRRAQTIMQFRDLSRPCSGRQCSTSDSCARMFRPIGHRRCYPSLRAGSENGKGANLVPSDARPEDFRKSLADLSMLVRAQQQQLQQQQQVIEQFQVVPARSHPLTAGWGSPRNTSMREESNTSPFDSQRIGIGDRRLLGLFDSRFHSTSR